MGRALSGKGGRLAVGDSNLCMKSWDTDETGEDQDTTCFEDGGVGTGVIGVREVAFNGKGDWDFDAGQTDDPPGLYPRDDLADLAFYRSVDENSQFAIPIARILSSKNSAAVKGQPVAFEFSGKSNGTYTRY